MFRRQRKSEYREQDACCSDDARCWGMGYITLTPHRALKMLGHSELCVHLNRIIAHCLIGGLRHARLQADPPGFPGCACPLRRRADIHRQPSFNSNARSKPHLCTTTEDHIMREHYHSNSGYLLHRQLSLPRDSVLVDCESLSLGVVR